jgi:hypothetical protein
VHQDGIKMKLLELLNDVSLTEAELMEMASFRPNRTGIERTIIWMGPKHEGPSKHGPRVKVSANYTTNVKPGDLFVLTVSKDPVIVAGVCNLKTDTLEDIKDWIKINYDVLLQFWNYQIDDDTVKEKVNKLP